MYETMKKIFLLSLTALLAIATFTSCENDEIDTIEIGSHRDQYYPEAFTTWGSGPDEVKNDMGKYGLSTSSNVSLNDVEYTDGTTDQKWTFTYYGKNPFETANDIIYIYYFDTATSGLFAVEVILYIDQANIDKSDITSQMKAHGYEYVNYNSQEYYHNYKSSKSYVRVYDERQDQSKKHYTLVYQKADETKLLKSKNVLN